MQKPDAQNLSLFQDKLLEALWQGGAPEDIRQALLDDPVLESFHDYIRDMDVRMIAVGCELVHKWGRGRVK